MMEKENQLLKRYGKGEREREEGEEERGMERREVSGEREKREGGRLIPYFL